MKGASEYLDQVTLLHNKSILDENAFYKFNASEIYMSFMQTALIAELIKMLAHSVHQSVLHDKLVLRCWMFGMPPTKNVTISHR